MLELTDTEVINRVLEGTGLIAEFGEEATEKYGHTVDLTVARKWIAQADIAEKALEESRKVQKRYSVIYNAKKDLRQKLKSEGITDTETHIEMQKLYLQEGEILEILHEKSSAFNIECDLAFKIGKDLFIKEKKKRQPKPKKDYQALALYWANKIEQKKNKLERLKVMLARVEKEYQIICSTGNEITKHFHLGMVGGSGKNVQKLNKKRETQLDKELDTFKRLQLCRERVAQLNFTINRYQKNYDNAVAKTV